MWSFQSTRKGCEWINVYTFVVYMNNPHWNIPAQKSCLDWRSLWSYDLCVYLKKRICIFIVEYRSLSVDCSKPQANTVSDFVMETIGLDYHWHYIAKYIVCSKCLLQSGTDRLFDILPWTNDKWELMWPVTIRSTVMSKVYILIHMSACDPTAFEFSLNAFCLKGLPFE